MHTQQDGKNEEGRRDQQNCPSDWSLGCEGLIIRPFLNEVTSSLDINLFSVSQIICTHVSICVQRDDLSDAMLCSEIVDC